MCDCRVEIEKRTTVCSEESLLDQIKTWASVFDGWDEDYSMVKGSLRKIESKRRLSSEIEIGDKESRKKKRK